MVAQLCDMGFPEDQVRAALQAAFNNADRAVEFLMNGIPEQTVQSSGGAMSGGPTLNSLEELRQHADFPALRQQIQSNPAMLSSVLQGLASRVGVICMMMIFIECVYRVLS